MNNNSNNIRARAASSGLTMLQQYVVLRSCFGHRPELHMTTSELWFGQEQEGILP